MRKANLSLIIGGIILLALLTIAIFPRWFTHVNPYGVQTVQSISSEGSTISLSGAPFPPSKSAFFGSDEMGRDVLSLIVYGTRLTLSLALLVVLGRFTIALPIGMSAGFGSKFCKGLISEFSTIFSAIPVLLISVIILSMAYFKNLPKNKSAIAFVVVLSLIDWAKLALIITERVENILARPFIKGEIAIGKSTFKIALENVIPHLSTELVALFFMEVARALTILMELGVFGVFVGNLRFIEDSEGGIIKTMMLSFEPEWASMLATSRYFVISAPWTVFFPALAFFLSILGFNLFGDGLKNNLEKRDSKFIVYVRRIVSLDLSGFRSIMNYKRTKGILVVLFIGILTTVYILRAESNFKSTEVLAYSNISLKDRVIIGTPEGKETADKLSKAMKNIGLQPIKDNYIFQYATGDLYLEDSSSIKISDGSKNIDLIQDRDYMPMFFGNFNISASIYDASTVDFFNIKSYKEFNEKVVLIDGSFYSKEAVELFTKNILENSTAKGVLCQLPRDKKYGAIVGNDVLKGAAFWMTEESFKKIRNSKDNTIKIVFNCSKLDGMGRNIIGMLPGKDAKVNEEAIIIGLPYNYTEKDSELGQKRILLGMELMRKLASEDKNRSRTIMLAFWDGTISDDYNGIKHFIDNNIYPSNKSVIYIDLTKLNGENVNSIYLNLSQAPISKYFSWSFATQFKRRLESEPITIRTYDNVRYIDEILAKGPNIDEMMYYKGAIPTIILSTNEEDTGKGSFTLDKLGRLLIDSIKNNNY